MFVHPDIPGERTGLVIGQRMTRELERQLDLTVMIALVPEHVLKQKDGVVVVNIHGAMGLDFSTYGFPHCVGAVVEQLCETGGIALVCPFVLRHAVTVRGGEVGGVFEDEDEAHVVHVGEELCDRRAAFHGSDFHTRFRDDAQQVGKNCVVAIP